MTVIAGSASAAPTDFVQSAANAPARSAETWSVTRQRAIIPLGASAVTIASDEATVTTKIEAAPDYTGWQPLTPGYCYTVSDTTKDYNHLGWTIWTATLQTYNFCPWNNMDGSGMWSNPVDVHGESGYGYCGEIQPLAFGYIAPNQWGFQASVVFQFEPGPVACKVAYGQSMTDQFWGNGHWNWDDYVE